MKTLICAALLFAACCFPADVPAQARGAGVVESQADEDLAACNDDPQCRAAMRKEAARIERAAAIHAAKPWYEKLLPWLLIGGGFWALWKWLGRASPASAANR